MRHRDQVLVPGLVPPGWAAELLSDPGDHDVLGIGAELRSERAADIRGDHPYFFWLDAEHLGEGAFGALGALVRDPGGQPAVVAPDGCGRPALHRCWRDPLVGERAADDDLAAVEQIWLQAAGVAEFGDDVGARLFEQDRLVDRKSTRLN